MPVFFISVAILVRTAQFALPLILFLFPILLVLFWTFVTALTGGGTTSATIGALAGPTDLFSIMSGTGFEGIIFVFFLFFFFFVDAGAGAGAGVFVFGFLC